MGNSCTNINFFLRLIGENGGAKTIYEINSEYGTNAIITRALDGKFILLVLAFNKWFGHTVLPDIKDLVEACDSQKAQKIRGCSISGTFSADYLCILCSL